MAGKIFLGGRHQAVAVALPGLGDRTYFRHCDARRRSVPVRPAPAGFLTRTTSERTFKVFVAMVAARVDTDHSFRPLALHYQCAGIRNRSRFLDENSADIAGGIQCILVSPVHIRSVHPMGRHRRVARRSTLMRGDFHCGVDRGGGLREVAGLLSGSRLLIGFRCIDLCF